MQLHLKAISVVRKIKIQAICGAVASYAIALYLASMLSYTAGGGYPRTFPPQLKECLVRFSTSKWDPAVQQYTTPQVVKELYARPRAWWLPTITETPRVVDALILKDPICSAIVRDVPLPYANRLYLYNATDRTIKPHLES